MSEQTLSADEHDEDEDEVSTHWITKATMQILLTLFLATQAAIALCLARGTYWPLVLFVPFLSHVMHGYLIAFHEATHGSLRRNRTLNEVDGVMLGIMSFMSFSLYRAAHQTHHAHLGLERDEELWPFVDTSVPRWKRVLAAVLELNCGLLFTPALFIRSFLRKDSPIRSKRVRRRIWLEFALVVGVWAIVLTVVAHYSLWHYFVWMYLVPAFLAGNAQSWRKYVEHVGLTGTTIRSGTRSIVADSLWGRLVSYSLLHEPYHGVHHQKPGLRHFELPHRQDLLRPTREDEYAPFRSYGHAIWHLLRSLADPKVGPQWRGKGPTEAS